MTITLQSKLLKKCQKTIQNLQWATNRVVKYIKYVQDQGLQSIGRNKPMVGTQDATLIIAPGLN